MENNIVDERESTIDMTIVDECEAIIDEHFSSIENLLFKKKRFTEITENDSVLYRFKGFCVEIIIDRIAVFAKYNSKYFYRDDYESTEKFCEDGLKMFDEFYTNPVIKKHSFVRLLHRLKGK